MSDDKQEALYEAIKKIRNVCRVSATFKREPTAAEHHIREIAEQAIADFNRSEK